METNSNIAVNPRGKWQLLILALFNYFIFMMITNIIGVLLTNWKEDFQLTPSVMILLGSVFFLAYGLTSLPQGILSERIGSKKTFLWGALLIFIGSLLFGFVPSFVTGLISLFIIGTGVTALQIVGNLLVKRIDEDPEKYSRNLTMAQVFCGIGAMSGGLLNSYLTSHFDNFHWTTFYFVFAVLIFVLGVFALSTPIPENTTKKEMPGLQDYLNLATNPLMIIFALGIFTYVGIEVGIANWIKHFLSTKYDASSAFGDKIFATFWLLQSIGRFTGGAVLNFLKTSKSLILYALGALVSLIVAIFAPSAMVSGIAFIVVGFFTSIMFPSIFSLAVNNFSDKEDVVAGVLCTAIIGGAVTQWVIGKLAEPLGLTVSLCIMSVVSFGYIAFIGLKTLGSKQ